MQVSPDFEYSKPQEDTKLQFVHRKTADADLYFVDNRNDRDEALDATFRIQGRRRSFGIPIPARLSLLLIASRTGGLPCLSS